MFNLFILGDATKKLNSAFVLFAETNGNVLLLLSQSY